VFRRVSGKIIIKRIKVDFIFQQQVSAVIGGFVKHVFKKQWPHDHPPPKETLTDYSCIKADTITIILPFSS